jgi:hypothetical protein
MRKLLSAFFIRWGIWAALLALGVVITPHYGESWDERQFFKYADRALEAYSTWPQTGSVPLTGNTYDNYGPAYVMLTALGARLLSVVLPWTTSDLRHLLYFATFLVGLWAFHRLCRRWLSPIAAAGAVLLFGTQPVVWGHAFISPKDVPFLAFFLITLVLGLEMVDGFHARSQQAAPEVIPRHLLLLTAAWLLVVFALIVAAPMVQAQIARLVHDAAAGEINLLSRIASDVRTIDPAVYNQKYFVLFLRIRGATLLALTILLAALWRKNWRTLSRMGIVAPAAVALGFTTSIRVLGPLAALLVAIYALRVLGRRGVPLLLWYALLALLRERARHVPVSMGWPSAI